MGVEARGMGTLQVDAQGGGTATGGMTGRGSRQYGGRLMALVTGDPGRVLS